MKRSIPPVPGERSDREFERVVASGGWELVELLFGGRTDLHRKWKHMTGAECRSPKRRLA
jgi:hypothetical protein